MRQFAVYLSSFLTLSSRIGESRRGSSFTLPIDAPAMSDSSPDPERNPMDLPPSTIYDPADDQVTPFGAEPTGTVVLLLVGDVDRWWAAETAVELSSTWARNGRRIVLADLFLENPILHEVTGAENMDGIVDVFLYGASISRSARPVSGRGFYLIPAGTYTSDHDVIFRHSRWPKLVAGFRDADASLLLFAPADAPELAALAPWVSQVVLLGAPRESAVLGPLLAAGAEVRGLLEPTRAPAFPPLDVLTLPAAAARGEAEEPRAETALHLPPPPVRTARQPPRLLNIVLGVLIPLVLLGAAAYIFASLRPDLLPAWARPTAPVADQPARVTPPRVITPIPLPRRQGETLTYSVGVISFRSFSGAQRRLTSLRDRKDGVLYFISPEEIQGILYYKVLAGALPDSTAARQLKERLVKAKLISAEDAADAGALIQPTPYAFDLGERATDSAATAAADSFAVRNVPAYDLAVPFSDGSRRWQLYGGAFADSTTAEGMRKLLSTAGVTPKLVPRVGVRAAPEG